MGGESSRAPRPLSTWKCFCWPRVPSPFCSLTPHSPSLSDPVCDSSWLSFVYLCSCPWLSSQWLSWFCYSSFLSICHSLPLCDSFVLGCVAVPGSPLSLPWVSCFCCSCIWLNWPYHSSWRSDRHSFKLKQPAHRELPVPGDPLCNQINRALEDSLCSQHWTAGQPALTGYLILGEPRCCFRGCFREEPVVMGDREEVILPAQAGGWSRGWVQETRGDV